LYRIIIPPKSNPELLMRRLLATVLLALAAALPCFADPPAKPKLAVLVVFDQMRGDYLMKWRDLFGTDGFRRLQTEGAWFTNCHYPYAMTATGPGHASMLSGCSADRHGIVANTWYERNEAATVNCATSRRYERVPPKVETVAPTDKKESDDGEKKIPGVGAPVRMLAPTLGDVIKETTGGKGKVFGLSLKDRSALLPAGAKPDGCYWFDKGTFVTSTYFRDRLHPWVATFNAEKSFDRWFGKTWDRFKPDLDYVRYSGLDDVVGEGKGAAQGRTFPHPMGAKTTLGNEYYAALVNSPFGNQMLLELACRAIVEERLGQRDEADLLIVSFSSNDAVGHIYGPDSQEVLDVTLRSDLIVRDLLACLDRHVGKGRYVLGMTADHGVCPLPEVTKNGGRMTPIGVLSAAETHLRSKLGLPPDDVAHWIEAGNEAGIYLNRNAIAAHGKKLENIAATLAKWFAEQPGIQAAYTQAALRGEIPASDEVGRRVKKSFLADRSGDVLLVPKPYHVIWGLKTGTSHGTPHPYDTHVPLIVVGPGVKPGQRGDAVTPQALAASLARALGVAAPAKAEALVPPGLFE
jgi:hypothetical protein